MTVGCSSAAIVPAATMFTGEAGGCGNFHVYRFNDKKTLAISLIVNEKALAIKEGITEIDLQTAATEVKLEVMQFASPAIEYFCDDVGGDALPFATWLAVAGQIHVENTLLVAPHSHGNATHLISVALMNVQIKNKRTGETTILPLVEIKDVPVGWSPG